MEEASASLSDRRLSAVPNRHLSAYSLPAPGLSQDTPKYTGDRYGQAAFQPRTTFYSGNGNGSDAFLYYTHASQHQQQQKPPPSAEQWSIPRQKVACSDETNNTQRPHLHLLAHSHSQASDSSTASPYSSFGTQLSSATSLSPFSTASAPSSSAYLAEPPSTLSPRTSLQQRQQELEQINASLNQQHQQHHPLSLSSGQTSPVQISPAPPSPSFYLSSASQDGSAHLSRRSGCFSHNEPSNASRSFASSPVASEGRSAYQQRALSFSQEMAHLHGHHGGDIGHGAGSMSRQTSGGLGSSSMDHGMGYENVAGVVVGSHGTSGMIPYRHQPPSTAVPSSSKLASAMQPLPSQSAFHVFSQQPLPSQHQNQHPQSQPEHHLHQHQHLPMGDSMPGQLRLNAAMFPSALSTPPMVEYQTALPSAESISRGFSYHHHHHQPQQQQQQQQPTSLGGMSHPAGSFTLMSGGSGAGPAGVGMAYDPSRKPLFGNAAIHSTHLPPPGMHTINSSIGKNFLPLHAPLVQERPFRCDQCPQSFNRNHDLKRHKRIHLSVKPFPCNYCNKSFSRKDALKRHRLVKGCGDRLEVRRHPTVSGSNTATATITATTLPSLLTGSFLPGATSTGESSGKSHDPL